MSFIDRLSSFKDDGLDPKFNKCQSSDNSCGPESYNDRSFLDSFVCSKVIVRFFGVRIFIDRFICFNYKFIKERNANGAYLAEGKCPNPGCNGIVRKSYVDVDVEYYQCDTCNFST